MSIEGTVLPSWHHVSLEYAKSSLKVLTELLTLTLPDKACCRSWDAWTIKFCGQGHRVNNDSQNWYPELFHFFSCDWAWVSLSVTGFERIREACLGSSGREQKGKWGYSLMNCLQQTSHCFDRIWVTLYGSPMSKDDASWLPRSFKCGCSRQAYFIDKISWKDT